MSNKNTLIIEGKEYSINYINGTISRTLILIQEGTPGHLPMNGTEIYPFKKIKNEIYFEMGKKFYKVVNKKDVLEISKEEYDEIKKYIIPNKNVNDSNVVKKYKNIVIDIVIKEIIKDKYNKKISIPQSITIIKFLNGLNLKENLYIDRLTKQIMLELPAWIKRDEIITFFKREYARIFQKDKENMRLFLDSIYENNKDYFESIYDSALESGQMIEERTKETKREKHQVKLTLPARGARPAPPVSTALGPSGINIHKFCADFNEWSKDLEGNVEFGVIIYDDLSYDILTKDEMNRREMAETAALFKQQYDPTYALRGTTSSLINNEQQNPISIIREKLEELYSLYGGNPTGGEIIAIEELDCAIGKGRDLHFDQNELSYYAEEGFIHIKGTKDNFSSRSHIQLTGKNIVVLADIKEGSKEFEYLSNVIKKIDSILQDNKKKR